MAETIRAVRPRAGTLDLLLLDTKLAIPAPRDGFVSRASLIDTARDSGRAVVAITAPSGYGKSSLLAQWAAVEDRPVAWVSLDRFDDDAATLLTLLASAFARATGADSSIADDMRGHGPSVLGRSAPRLAAAFRTSPQPFVMMLDDLHELNSPACHDALTLVIAGIPPGSQFVAASRVEQPHLPRLRTSGATLELGVDDLALDANGAQQIFAEADLLLSPDLADTVTARTEGWPVGVYLAAKIAHDGADLSIAVSGDDRYVADYLYRESLSGLPDDVQRFLRRTAVLESFSAELCDGLLDERGSQLRLLELEAMNVFLVPLDRRREWYRYHPLFREFLLGELRRVEPASIPELHTRAADWYECNGSAAMAIEHLLQTPDGDRCVRLVADVALATYQAGQLQTVQRWITALGDRAVAAYPPLAVLAGWSAVVSGHPVTADRWADALEGFSYDSPPADGSASFESGRAMLRAMMCAHGPEQAIADAAFALAEEPDWSVWRDQALCLAAEGQLLAGDVEGAEALFTEASDVAVSNGNHDVHVLADAELAMVAMDQGRWVEAAGRIDSAVASIAEHRLNDYATAVPALAGAARLSLHRGVPTVERDLVRAMRARQFSTYAAPTLAVRARLSLAKTYFAVGDGTTSRHLLREIADIELRRPALGALGDDVRAFRSVVDSAAPGAANGVPPLTPAELRLLPYLQTHLTMPEIGARLFVSRNTVSTEVGSIYRKLGVSSRSDAVDRATAIGLIGG
ncbi:LuxR C-terminal-related transcriptional regulator [Herbiconiux sp. CPCC 205763]|uniref:LuxR C-terminal-related transcriptional regulator n=1 Tax=Herbiconiux aconitum TaxID=2970913 RepID=A0ABT2GQE5_9MICO|nr:LuxR family transcriptional regulator [Herbiconiux aconitum]MCS5718398.1 LuxR C-terminal-related transcriptional regulator [Herbiconiux aconitum]